jgi:predicted GNAT family N-acyltransferase
VKVTRPKTKEEFDRYYELRWRVLRKPWQQPRGSEKDERENRAEHIMVCDDRDTCIGVGRLHFNTKTEAQIRYMAVDERHRGRGIGKMILVELERIAREKGATSIVLNARDDAISFYRNIGYEELGPGHTLFGSVKHVKMGKRLAESPP